jgi:hypothetical protein
MKYIHGQPMGGETKKWKKGNIMMAGFVPGMKKSGS